jgi:hypothetical protein
VKGWGGVYSVESDRRSCCQLLVHLSQLTTSIYACRIRFCKQQTSVSVCVFIVGVIVFIVICVAYFLVSPADQTLFLVHIEVIN